MWSRNARSNIFNSWWRPKDKERQEKDQTRQNGDQYTTKEEVEVEAVKQLKKGKMPGSNNITSAVEKKD